MRRHGAPSLRELDRLLPTPNASIGRNATARKPGDTFAPGWTLHDVAHANRWGDYAPAIARHAATIGGGPPPEPLDDKGRLNAVFVEWMMAWPSGHVTGRGLARSAELRILGNGVVPPQAFAAYDYLLNLDVPA
jgi:DNA (cytosine-5)-methyltransferase 1